MKIPFSKYQGTGNDFILLDNRDSRFSQLTTEQVNALCDRRFGIGADGLILLEDREGYDFYMKYYNSDGNESSMCGNGGRCIAAYAKRLSFPGDHLKFLAIDGEHLADILPGEQFIIKLKMADVNSYETIGDDLFLNTGSPHYVRFVDDVMKLDLVNEGRKVRYNERFKAEGTNVNFVQPIGDTLVVRSYERGVEDETLSCGTGVTASALASVIRGVQKGDKGVVKIQTMGGALRVHYEKAGNGFRDVYLEGPATFVYNGEIEI
jgi:diaminopimelate epimerase